MMENKYSIKKIISHDYITLLSFASTIIMVVFLVEIYFVGYFFSRRGFELIFIPSEDRFLYYYVFGGIALIGFLCFILRINIIRNYFFTGIEVKGVISELMYWRDRGRITFIYNIEDQKYCKNITIHTTKMTANFGKNDEIKVLVKPENHSKAIIKNLFDKE